PWPRPCWTRRKPHGTRARSRSPWTGEHSTWVGKAGQPAILFDDHTFVLDATSPELHALPVTGIGRCDIGPDAYGTTIPVGHRSVIRPSEVARRCR
ncbi:hypothetical protein ACFQ1S_03890, partial [Kibdelosporangium lantanae]